MKVIAEFLKGLPGRALAALSLAAVAFSSCELVREDLAECQSELRFIYDYNMEFANAFHKQVDCLSVYFFNSEGQLVTVKTMVDSERLADEEYRMLLDLPEGSYRAVAYGGMACGEASFGLVHDMTAGKSHLSDLHVQLDPESLTNPDRYLLHNHFYGYVDFTIDPLVRRVITLPMMRNTNTIQVALQHENGAPIDHNDFTFEIEDDNNYFDCDNNLIPTGDITYQPYELANSSTGTVAGSAADGETEKEWYAALARFTTSRLVVANEVTKPFATRLHVRRSSNGETVLRVPLVNYMLMFKQDNNSVAGLGDMGDQEYLDRENRWNFVFFLKDNVWLKTHIIINDWDVRLNDAGF